MLLIEYPKCTTCQKARKFLDNNNLKYDTRHIKEERLNKEELDKLIKKSNLDINKFFNTSGIKYRELNLKDKLPNLSYEEKLEILSQDGMLVKRPILESKDIVLVGFKEKEWSKLLK